MNSRKKRKLNAQQHNDAIDYNKWLLENTLHQSRRRTVNNYLKARSFGLSRFSALAICSTISQLGFNP